MDISKEDIREEGKKTDRGRALLVDGIFMLTSFLFARCHTLFGARPLGLALICALPSHLFPSLAGAALGSLSLGREGVVLALVLAISLFLRLAISGSVQGLGTGKLRLKEGTLLRLSVSCIGGFILSVYKILLLGFGKAEILYSAFMIFITPLSSFVFVTLFESGFSAEDVAKRLRSIITLRGRDEGERVRRIAFLSSLLITAFFISLSLKPFELFGISLSYIFTAVLSLVASRRAGAFIGAGLAFLAALPLSPIHAAAFALSALTSGALFGLGIPYAMIGGGAMLSLFVGYTEGLSGFLSVFAEYVIGASICYPLLKRLNEDTALINDEDVPSSAKDMVGTMALAYQSRYRGRAEALEKALSLTAKVIGRSTRSSAEHSLSVRELVVSEIKYAARLIGREVSDEDVLRLASTVANGDLTAASEDISRFFDGEEQAGAILERLALGARELSHAPSAEGYFSEALSVAAAAIRSAIESDEAERGVDREEEDRLTEALVKAGLDGGVACALGERKKHLIIAGRDPSGTVITDPIVKRSLEEILMRPLGSQEYYRRGPFALMECTAMPRLTLEHATSTYSHESDVSGDVSAVVESNDGRIYALISDGMGTGREAHAVSRLVAEIFSSLASSGVSPSHALQLANGIIRARGGEISATVDLFELDMMSAEAGFIKCGAAVSYVKRDSSIFRIRSRTAPIGLLPSPDAERVSVEVRQGDIIVMLSDGLNPTASEAPWLLDLLSRSDGSDLKRLADSIIDLAKRNTPARDDMTAVVLRVAGT